MSIGFPFGVLLEAIQELGVDGVPTAAADGRMLELVEGAVCLSIEFGILTWQNETKVDPEQRGGACRMKLGSRAFRNDMAKLRAIVLA